jgi:hypothetical protein
MTTGPSRSGNPLHSFIIYCTFCSHAYRAYFVAPRFALILQYSNRRLAHVIWNVLFDKMNIFLMLIRSERLDRYGSNYRFTIKALGSPGTRPEFELLLPIYAALFWRFAALQSP